MTVSISNFIFFVLFVVLIALALLLSVVVQSVLRYALFERHKNSKLRGAIPDGGFPFLLQMRVGGIPAAVERLQSLCKQADTFPPLAFVGASFSGSQTLACCSADGLRDVFTKTDVFAKSREMYDALESLGGMGLATSNGELWHAQRRRLTPMFHLGKLRSYTPLMNDEGAKMCDAIAARGGATIGDAPRIFSKTALQLIVRAVFGERLDVARVGALWSVATEGMIVHSIARRLLPRPLVRLVPRAARMLDACAELDRMFAGVVADCRAAQSETDDAPFDFVAQMALLRDDAGNWEIPVQLIADECKTFTFAAQDTTANLLSFAMLYVGQDKELQRELAAESRAAFPTTAAAFNVEEPNQLPLHRAVLNESLRLGMVAPWLIRTVTEDTVLCGHEVEKGTEIVALMSGPHLSAEHYAEPRAFRPKRWLDGSLNERHPFSFLAFSAGPRSCIGQKLSINEATILLAHLMQRFEVVCENPHEVVPAVNGSIEPHGMRIRFTERSTLQH